MHASVQELCRVVHWTPEDALQACCGTVCVLCMRLHRTGLKQSCVGENRAEFLRCVAALQRCHAVCVVTTAAKVRGLCHVLQPPAMHFTVETGSMPIPVQGRHQNSLKTIQSAPKLCLSKWRMWL